MMPRQFYILSLKHSKLPTAADRSEHLIWWGPDNCGYTGTLDRAGRYTEEQIAGEPAYYDNGHSTVALDCDVVDAYARRTVPAGELGAIIARAKRRGEQVAS
jgi:hypothetical protein